MSIQFQVLENGDTPQITNNEIKVFLLKDSWNDWWEYKTLFGVYFSDGKSIEWIGTIKIGEKDLIHNADSVFSTEIPDSFEQLGDSFFSLGQDVTYYNNINKLEPEMRFQILKSLNDIALDEELYEEIKDERIVYRSLLRSVSTTSVKGQYRRLANGNATLTNFYFSYQLPNNELNSSFEIEVTPESIPPSNLHVIIGRNGVGKTNLIKNLVNYLRTNKSEYGQLTSEVSKDTTENLFANLVSVSFSSFDSENTINDEDEKDLKYYNIGLLKKENDNYIPKSLKDLQKEFSDSLDSLNNSAKTKRWKQAIRTLESDPIFQGLGIEYLIHPEYKDRITSIFKSLSSGHKIVLLTITKLVETVEERSLVILDEPETHLHPPLLSAFTRALSDLLIFRNAVALVATHSPVLVQEVPKNCVWIMNRTNRLVSFDRPEIETFGENLGTLTREIFGLEVTSSGFHAYLKNAVKKYDDYDEIIESFNGNLGMEARTILRSLLLNKRAGR